MTADRSARARRPPKRKVTLALALVLIALAAVVGLVVGLTAGSNRAGEPSVTLERDVPVVTVTPGQ
ncbi:MAG: hypothetical protein U0Y82_06995 [Thermoleophilia bacterium]